MAKADSTITVGIDVVIQSVRMGTTKAPADTEPATDRPARVIPPLEVMAEAMAYCDMHVFQCLTSQQQIGYLNHAGALLTAIGVPGGGICQETMTAIQVGDEAPALLRCVVDARHTPPHRTGDGTHWTDLEPENQFADRPGMTCCDGLENCCVHDIPQHGCVCCEHAVKIGARRWTE